MLTSRSLTEVKETGDSILYLSLEKMYAAGRALSSKKKRRRRMLVADTLVIDALRHDESLLDRIITFDGRFAKFRAVLNDERVASALSLKDVAHMLDVAAGVLLDFANGLAPMKLRNAPSEVPTSAQIDPNSTSATTLDLRPLFERGIEPLATVLDAVAALKPGVALIVEAPFHPLPLRRLLGGRGLESRATQLSPEHWQIFFRRGDSDGQGAMSA